MPYAWEIVVPGPPAHLQKQAWNPELPPANSGAGPPGSACGAAACNPGSQPATVPWGCGPGLGTVLVVTTGAERGGPAGPWQAGVGLLPGTPQLPGRPPPPWVMQPRSRGAEKPCLQPGRPETPGLSPNHEGLISLPFWGRRQGKGDPATLGAVLQAQHGLRSPKGGRSRALPPGPPRERSCPLQGGGHPGGVAAHLPVAPRPRRYKDGTDSPTEDGEARPLQPGILSACPTPGGHHRVLPGSGGVPETGLLRKVPAAPGPGALLCLCPVLELLEVLFEIRVPLALRV